MGKKGGSGKVAEEVEDLFYFFKAHYPKRNPRRGLHFQSLFVAFEGAEDVGAEHYRPDNCSPAQCNGIRRVENSMQGHHSRSHGPEKETFGL